MDENVKTAWAQVDNQLKRRYDLIPNLVETVKGYAAHERGLFEHIADARTKYFQAPDVKGKIEASGQLEQALSRLLVLRESYPQLKANETFLKMMDSLEGTENRLSVERKRYNDAVRTLHPHRLRAFLRQPGRGQGSRILPGPGGRKSSPEGEILTNTGFPFHPAPL
jgi:LemA protein